MIKFLFNKPLITCDHPSDCKHYVNLRDTTVEEVAKLKELGWVSLTVGNKMVFFCRQCKMKPALTKQQIERMLAGLETAPQESEATNESR